MAIPDDFVSIERAAELLHCSTRAIWRAIASGKLHKYKPLGQVLLRLSEIEGRCLPVERPTPAATTARRQAPAAVKARLRKRGHKV